MDGVHWPQGCILQCSCESSIPKVFLHAIGRGATMIFLCMPNVYAQAPLLLTKLFKQPFGFLRKHGYALVVYIDDSYLQGDCSNMVVYSAPTWKGVKSCSEICKRLWETLSKPYEINLSGTTGLGLVVAQHYACLSPPPPPPCWVDLIFWCQFGGMVWHRWHFPCWGEVDWWWILWELHAAQRTLLALAPNVSHTHIRLVLDNTAAAAYFDKMVGLYSHTCNEIALPIWHWAKDRNIWLSTASIQGVENTVADFHSQNFRDNNECILNTVVFKQLTAISFFSRGWPLCE